MNVLIKISYLLYYMIGIKCKRYKQQMADIISSKCNCIIHYLIHLVQFLFIQ